MLDILRERVALNNSGSSSHDYFIEKIISCIFKSSHIKSSAASSQEYKCWKLGHRLESVLVDNLIKYSL